MIMDNEYLITYILISAFLLPGFASWYFRCDFNLRLATLKFNIICRNFVVIHRITKRPPKIVFQFND